jgi:hypothetical protein
MTYQLTGKQDDPIVVLGKEPLSNFPYRSDIPYVCIVYHGNAIQFLNDHPEYVNSLGRKEIVCGRCHHILRADGEHTSSLY